MVTKKSVKSKAPEKKIFTDSEYSVKRIYQKSPKKKQLKMLENILLLEVYILECSVKDSGP